MEKQTGGKQDVDNGKYSIKKSVETFDGKA